MSPAEFLGVIDHALAPGRKGKYRLMLTAPMVLGQAGAYVEGEGYGFTKRQVKRMRAAILDAARADRLATPSDDDGEFTSNAPSLDES